MEIGMTLLVQKLLNPEPRHLSIRVRRTGVL